MSSVNLHHRPQWSSHDPSVNSTSTLSGPFYFPVLESQPVSRVPPHPPGLPMTPNRCSTTGDRPVMGTEPTLERTGREPRVVQSRPRTWTRSTERGLQCDSGGPSGTPSDPLFTVSTTTPRLTYSPLRRSPIRDPESRQKKIGPSLFWKRDVQRHFGL